MNGEAEEADPLLLKILTNELNQEINNLKVSEQNKIATIKLLKNAAAESVVKTKVLLEENEKNEGRIKKLDQKVTLLTQKIKIAIDQKNEAVAEKEKLTEEVKELKKQIYEAKENKENEPEEQTPKKQKLDS